MKPYRGGVKIEKSTFTERKPFQEIYRMRVFCGKLRSEDELYELYEQLIDILFHEKSY